MIHQNTSYLKSNNKAKSDGKKFPVKQCVFSIVVSELFVSMKYRRMTVENKKSMWHIQLQCLHSEIQEYPKPGKFHQWKAKQNLIGQTADTNLL